MYYLLNFYDHTFRTCNTAGVVAAELEDIKEEGKDPGNFEVINCFDGLDDSRTDGQSFLAEFASDDSE